MRADLGAESGALARACSRVMLLLHRVRLTHLVATLAVGTVGALACATPASACDHTSNEKENHHCYSQSTLKSEGNPMASEGVSYVLLGCIGLPNGWENLMTDEMWTTLKGGNWVEGGIITGVTLAGQYELPGFFTSANIVGKSTAFYNEHLGGLAPTNTWNLTYSRQASPNNSSTWVQWTAGTGTATYTGFNTAAAATSLTVGLETTVNGGWNHAAASGLAVKGANGNTYTTEWRSGSHVPEIEKFGPEFGTTEAYYNWTQPYYQTYFGDHPGHGC